MTTRSKEAIAALHEAARELDALCGGYDLARIHEAAGMQVARAVVRVKVRSQDLDALADAPDPLAEAREAVAEAQARPDDCPLEFNDTRPTVRVLMTVAGWRVLRRALGMGADGE